MDVKEKINSLNYKEEYHRLLEESEALKTENEELKRKVQWNEKTVWEYQGFREAIELVFEGKCSNEC